MVIFLVLLLIKLVLKNSLFKNLQNMVLLKQDLLMMLYIIFFILNSLLYVYHHIDQMVLHRKQYHLFIYVLHVIIIFFKVLYKHFMIKIHCFLMPCLHQLVLLVLVKIIIF